MEVVMGENAVMPKDKLAAVQRRFEKRARNAVVGSYISPFPVSEVCKIVPEDTVVLRYMFPGSGSISKACIYIGCEMEKGTQVEITASVVTIMGASNSVSLTTRKNFTMIEIGLPVNVGDRLVVSVKSDTNISDVWTSFLWLPAVNNVGLKQFLKSELESLESSDERE
jgi:hypothetical protein